ncbi:MAG: GNAT family N-acetyltransferase [Lachnospiraceae bacterium]
MEEVLLTQDGLTYVSGQDAITARDSGGNELARIDIHEVSPKVYDICHTFVDPSLRGRGIASVLTGLAVERVQKEGASVTASCSYGKAWLSRHQNSAE